MEYAGSKNIKEYLNEIPKQQLPDENSVKIIFKNIVLAIKYLH